MAKLDSGDQASVTIKTWVEGGTPVVSLSGELDLTNAERVRSVIGDTLSRETERLAAGRRPESRGRRWPGGCADRRAFGQAGAGPLDFADVGFALAGVRGEGEHGDTRAGCVQDETAERIATLGGSPCGTPSALVAQRDWDDYSIGRAGTLEHLGALDVVYAGIIEAHRRAIDATEELDQVTQDMLIGQSGQLEQSHWFVRAHLEAKEYVACRNDENGTLVLSEFTGAADELAGAFGVNPHDIEGMKNAIVRAATTTPAEARRRMRAMRRRVREHDVARWAASFLDTLNDKAQPGGHSVLVPGKEDIRFLCQVKKKGLSALMPPAG
jgi:Glycosyltransferase family 20/Ferritin-like domain